MYRGTWIGKSLRVERKAAALAFGAALAFCVHPKPAGAWEDSQHKRFAGIVLEKAPSSLAKFLRERETDFFNGALEGDSLWQAIYEGKDARPKDADYYDAAVVSVAHQYRRASTAIFSKSPPGQTAWEFGLLVRLTMEFLEPYPDFKSFSFAEIAGTRPFFEADLEKRLERFDFLFDGLSEYKAPVQKLVEIAKMNRADAAVIYEGYQKGEGYSPGGPRAEASLNRSLNAAVDVLNSVWTGSAYRGGPAVDVRKSLGLDRFDRLRKGSDDKVAKPTPPKPPETNDAEPPKP